MVIPFYIVIMAGGRGTRLWPLSRQALPKQFLALQPGGQTLLQETTRRAAVLAGGMERVLVVTEAGQAALVHQQLPELPARNLLLEPVGRSTAACLGLAASHITNYEPQAVMVALPADHVYREEAPWRKAVETAVLTAGQTGRLVTVGVPPATPATAYGYIHLGEALSLPTGIKAACPVYTVRAFVEKPDAGRARAFVKSGEHLWNTGTFAWRVPVFQEALRRLLPELYAGLQRIADDPSSLEAVYPTLTDISVDYGVLEKWPDVAAVQGSFERIDVGNLASLAELWPVDAQGNSVYGEAIARDSQENIVYTDAGLVGLIGVEGLIIVRHGDVVLVCPRERAHEVKAIVAELDRPENEPLRRYR